MKWGKKAKPPICVAATSKFLLGKCLTWSLDCQNCDWLIFCWLTQILTSSLFQHLSVLSSLVKVLWAKFNAASAMWGNHLTTRVTFPHSDAQHFLKLDYVVGKRCWWPFMKTSPDIVYSHHLCLSSSSLLRSELVWMLMLLRLWHYCNIKSLALVNVFFYILYQLQLMSYQLPHWHQFHFSLLLPSYPGILLPQLWNRAHSFVFAK